MGASTIPICTLVGYKPERLHELLEEAKKELERAKVAKEWLENAIALKYQEQLRAKRLRMERDSGVVHLEDEGYRLTSEIKKRVDWDQEALVKVASQIALSGGVVSHYMRSYYEISEHDYKKWSANVQALFIPARVVKLGNPTYKLVKLDDRGVL